MCVPILGFPTPSPLPLSLAGVLGGPLGAAFLGPMDGVAGLAGWRWLFIIEGAATIALALALPWIVPETVGSATWLTPDEKKEAAAGLTQAARAKGVPVPETGMEAHDGGATDHETLREAFAGGFRILTVPQVREARERVINA